MPEPIFEQFDRMSHVSTGTYSPEAVEAMKRVAVELGSISVTTYDPTNPEERVAYAKLLVAKEVAKHTIGHRVDGEHSTPRTREQMDRDVIQYAERTGGVLVSIINFDRNKDLSDLWAIRRLEEAKPSRYTPWG